MLKMSSTFGKSVIIVLIITIGTTIGQFSIPTTGMMPPDQMAEQLSNIFSTLCSTTVGVEVDKNALKNEVGQCIEKFSDRIRENTGKFISTPEDMMKLGRLKNVIDTKAKIPSDLKIWLQTEVIESNCKEFKSGMKCVNLLNLKSTEKCVNFNETIKNQIETGFKYSEMNVDLFCDKNGENVFDLMDAGFISCFEQYGEKIRKCTRQLEDKFKFVETSTSLDSCQHLKVVNDCFMDVGDPNDSCKKEAIDSFKTLTSKIRNWIDGDCMGTGSIKSFSTILVMIGLVFIKFLN